MGQRSEVRDLLWTVIVGASGLTEVPRPATLKLAALTAPEKARLKQELRGCRRESKMTTPTSRDNNEERRRRRDSSEVSHFVKCGEADMPTLMNLKMAPDMEDKEQKSCTWARK